VTGFGSGFGADLPAITAAARTLRAALDALDVDLTTAGEVGPGRLAPAVSALLAGAEADLTRARAAVTALADSATAAGASYADADADAASRFHDRPW
jgi:hypothetical protein